MIKKDDLPLSMVIFQAPKAWPEIFGKDSFPAINPYCQQ